MNARPEHISQGTGGVTGRSRQRSIIETLFDAADAIAGGSVPAPRCLEVSAEFGLGVELATRAQFDAWAGYLRLSQEPWQGQPYASDDGTLCRLIFLGGHWHGGRVRLHCFEPLGTPTANPEHQSGDQADP